MDKTALQSLITASSILEPADRAYWLKTLPEMTDEQCNKLGKLLSDAERIPLKQNVIDYVNAVARHASSPSAA